MEETNSTKVYPHSLVQFDNSNDAHVGFRFAVVNGSSSYQAKNDMTRERFFTMIKSIYDRHLLPSGE